jgi:syntaxin 18
MAHDFRNRTSDLTVIVRGTNLPQTPRKEFSIEDIDAFLREAYRIVRATRLAARCSVTNTRRQNSHIAKLHNELKDVRQAYLSTAQPRKTHIRPGQEQQRYLTDRDREEIDGSAKKMLRELNASIRGMEEAEQLRRQTEEAMIQKKYGRGLGALGAWAAGGSGIAASAKTTEHAKAEAQAKGIELHRDGVLWYLRQRLQLCGQTQQKMMETRLTRVMEKNRSVLAKAAAPAMPELPGDGMQKLVQRQMHQEPDRSEELTEEQIQMFEKGNQDMMKHYESTLDKVR